LIEDVMKLFETLNEDNFLLYAAQNYSNNQCVDAEEFYDDLNRFKYIKRLISRYNQTGEIQERLLINHIVVIFNLFGIQAAKKMMWYRIKEQDWHIVKPVMLYLNYITESEKIDVGLDPLIVERLRHI
jgi:hypothetical protein